MNDRQICTKESPQPKDIPVRKWNHPDAVYKDDEYNGLSGGSDYEVYECPHCRKTIYSELPD